MSEIIEKMVKKSREAQSVISDYTQEQVDVMVKAIGKAIYDKASQISEMVVAETQLGDYESKLAKNLKSPAVAWHFLRDKKSVGVIDVDPEKCIVTIAKPMGVVAVLTPSTNPTTTAVVNGMHLLKGRNTAIIAPHPRAKKSTAYAVDLMNDAIRNLGGPDNVFQIIQEPTMELSQELMAACDITVATGGAGMVKAAYSSGKPSYGVGQGNVQVIVDEDYTDYARIAKNVVANRVYDRGMPCTGEQAIFVKASKKDELIYAFQKENAYYIDDASQIAALRNAIFDENAVIRRDVVGQMPCFVAKKAGIAVPENTKILLVKGEKIGKDDVLCKEVMCPLVLLFTYDEFEEAVDMARINYELEGAGHTAGIYTENPKKAEYAGLILPVGRVVVNQATVGGGGSSFDNGLDPTISIGCGSWGGNSISENLTYKHLLNYTRVSSIIPGVHIPTYDEIWEE